MLIIRTCIISILLALLSLSVIGQDLESLTQALQESKTDRQRFDALVNLSDYWSYRDTLKASKILLQAQPFISKNDYLQGIYLFYQAGIYYGYDNDKSQQLYMQADKYLKKFDTPEAFRYRARLWHNYGSLAQQADDDKQFLSITLDYCIPYAEKSGDNNLLMNYFTSVGLVFYNQKEYKKALEYYEKAVSLAQAPEDETENLLWSYLNMFDVYFYSNRIEKARRILLKSEDLLKKIPEKKLAGVFYKSKAKLLILDGDYDKALQSIEEGMRIVEKYNFYWDYISLKYEKALTYKMLGNWQAAKKQLEELLQDTENPNTNKNRLVLIDELSETEANLRNFGRAYELMRDYKELNDSINALNFKQQLADMETNYRTAEKERKIMMLENQNRFQQILFWGGVFLFFLLVMWIWYAWNNRKKRNQKDMLLLRQQREIDISKAIIDGEEQERKRLARDLHDGLMGRVTGLKMNIENTERDDRQKDIPYIVTELETVITELRHTAHNLEPAALKKHGLEDAILHFCQTMQSPKTNISFYSNGLSNITDKNLQLSAYRIVQELITNAVRHADASQILLQCTFKNNLLLIEVEDNGKGFDPATVSRNMGIRNLELRVKSIGGTMQIDSQQGKGTNINIECKLQ